MKRGLVWIFVPMGAVGGRGECALHNEIVGEIKRAPRGIICRWQASCTVAISRGGLRVSAARDPAIAIFARVHGPDPTAMLWRAWAGIAPLINLAGLESTTSVDALIERRCGGLAETHALFVVHDNGECAVGVRARPGLGIAKKEFPAVVKQETLALSGAQNSEEEKRDRSQHADGCQDRGTQLGS